VVQHVLCGELSCAAAGVAGRWFCASRQVFAEGGIKDAPELTEASVKGAITNYVSVANFMVAGRKVDASAAPFENGSAANLANGRQVEIEGRLNGAVLVAKKVSFQ
jgi:hypothetical protein